MIAAANNGGPHNQLFGFMALQKLGHQVDYLELEKFLPLAWCHWLRRNVLNMHLAHLPLFILFYRYDVVISSTAYTSLLLKAVLNKLGLHFFSWIIIDFNLIGTIGERKTLRQKLFYFSIKNGADAIVAISRAETDALKETFPTLAENIYFCHEATDTEFFHDQPVAKGDRPLVVSIGNFGRDFRPLVEVARRLPIDIIIGAKPSLLVGLDLPANVTAGQFNNDQLLDIYRRADIIYVAAKVPAGSHDSVGTLSLGEALSIGKPVICAYSTNFESYITDRVNGLFVPQTDAASLERAISGLLANPDKAKQIGDRARDFSLQYLSQNHFAFALDRIIKNLK